LSPSRITRPMANASPFIIPPIVVLLHDALTGYRIRPPRRCGRFTIRRLSCNDSATTQVPHQGLRHLYLMALIPALSFHSSSLTQALRGERMQPRWAIWVQLVLDRHPVDGSVRFLIVTPAP
jgi:hypothetical protein